MDTRLQRDIGILLERSEQQGMKLDALDGRVGGIEAKVNELHLNKAHAIGWASGAGMMVSLLVVYGKDVLRRVFSED